MSGIPLWVRHTAECCKAKPDQPQPLRPSTQGKQRILRLLKQSKWLCFLCENEFANSFFIWHNNISLNNISKFSSMSRMDEATGSCTTVRGPTRHTSGEVIFDQIHSKNVLYTLPSLETRRLIEALSSLALKNLISSLLHYSLAYSPMTYL